MRNKKMCPTLTTMNTCLCPETLSIAVITLFIKSIVGTYSYGVLLGTITARRDCPKRIRDQIKEAYDVV